MNISAKRILAASLFILILAAGCKKDEGKVDPSGYWRGLYGSGSSSPSQSYAILFRPNGTLRVYAQFSDTSMGAKAEGTYTMKGSQMNAQYTYFTGPLSGTFSAQADVNDGEDMQGTYGSGTSASGGGTFFLDAQ